MSDEIDEIANDIPQRWHYYPRCGDAFIPDGSECRYVRAAKEAGTFQPTYDEKTGERIEQQR
ncbi:MAG: hypothetical protein ACXWQ5_00575 [Ktedonobacterales bacterium]